MIGGKPHRSDDRAPQSAASRDRKGAPGGSVRGAALAPLGRARSTRRPPPRPPRPARSWPELRSRGPQPAAVRAPARVPRLACPSAAWRPPPARHGAGPVRTPPPSRARTRAVRHSRVPVLVPLAVVWLHRLVGWGGGGAAGQGAVRCSCCGGATRTPPGTTHGTRPLLLHLRKSASARLPRIGPTSAGRGLTTHFKFPAKTIHTRCRPKRIWLAKLRACMAKWSDCMAKWGACVTKSSR